MTALKACGAILLGKTTMHEIGLGVTGLNNVSGTPYNPHAPGHYTGGSSSGSAAVVAAGICPFAIGTHHRASCISSTGARLTCRMPPPGFVAVAGCHIEQLQRAGQHSVQEL